MSKIIGAIAYQQLVERGLASLDDPTTITTYLPELAAKKVLTGYGTDASTWKKTVALRKNKQRHHSANVAEPHLRRPHVLNTLLLDYIRDQVEAIWTNSRTATKK